MPKESKYAAKLRELGFKPYRELLDSADFAETEAFRQWGMSIVSQGLNRAQRRKLRALKADPTFFIMDGYTYVTDETGIDWGVQKEIDLVPHGFTNGDSNPNRKLH